MDLEIGERVDLIVGQISPLGFTVLINQAYEGLLYKNELYQKIEEGQHLVGYVKKLRDDGKLDVTLNPVGFKHAVVKSEIRILNKLKANEGFLPLHDKSSPDDIKYALEMSKKSFKSAIGGLYKQKLITIEKDGIRLV